MKKTVTRSMALLTFLLAAVLLLSSCSSCVEFLCPNFTIIYIVDDEVVAEINASTSAQVPPNPEKEGFAFYGWVWANSPYDTVGQKALKARCMTLTAVWAPIFEVNNHVVTGLTKEGKKLSHINIPSEIDGETITGIGREAFKGCQNITSIVIPESVSHIDSGAFSGCNHLESINIPQGVTGIEDSVFSGCSCLESITVPAGVTSIGEWAFSGCDSLTTVQLPSTITNIGSYSFVGCSNLTAITLPSALTRIGTYAFSGCLGLQTVSYAGGQAKWALVVKEANWNYNCTFQVVFDNATSA